MIKQIAAIGIMGYCAVMSSNYYAEISPEIANEIMHCAANAEYRQHLDYDGDGKLTVCDAVLVSKKYEYNCKYGNTIDISAEKIREIYTENYADDLVYYEICNINGENCRLYECNVSEISEICIYYEFENYGDTVVLVVNPFTESMAVIS